MTGPGQPPPEVTICGRGKNSPQYIKMDPTTNALLSIDCEHAKIHNGYHFTTDYTVELGNAAALNVHVKTPNTTMWAHILDALKEAVETYPDIIPYLKGMAAWYAGVWAVKEGEAPDDEQRLKDERKLARNFESFLQMQLERILKEIRKEYKGLRFDFWSEEERLLWEMLSEDFVGILIHGVNGGINNLGDIANLVNIDDLTGPIIQYGRTYRSQWLHLISETTHDFVEKSITDWIASGDPLKELIKTLSNPELGTFSKERAKRIATTEVTRLYAQGNQLAWEKSGTVKEFIWQTANDERVCPICGARHNKVYPLSQMGDIPAHPNCRCWAKPVVSYEGFANEIDRILGR